MLEYDLFIFDFDGTLMNTEIYHHKAWQKALAWAGVDKTLVENMDIKEYQKYFHSLDKIYTCNYLDIKYNIKNYDNLYEQKHNFYEEYIHTENISLIDGAENFLNFLIKNNKKFIIVTNSLMKYIKIFQDKYPILNKVHKIYTKELFINKKPNPECYLYISNEYKNINKIGFEDSLVGMHSLYQVDDITPVLIYDKEYFYTDLILSKYNNVIPLTKYNIDSFKKTKLINPSKVFIENIITNNINQINKNFSNITDAIYQISIILNNIDKSNHIYLSGMGKSGYICKKSASTWQSLAINCSYIDLPNLPHGDFGLFRDNDILLLISNSGNTDEIIYILNYIKNNLNKKITTISIVANSNSKMEELSNFTYVLDNIKESDLINMTPSTSSIIFMLLLDSIAINLKKNITVPEFIMYHPSGSLGKRLENSS